MGTWAVSWVTNFHLDETRSACLGPSCRRGSLGNMKSKLLFTPCSSQALQFRSELCHWKRGDQWGPSPASPERGTYVRRRTSPHMTWLLWNKAFWLHPVYPPQEIQTEVYPHRLKALLSTSEDHCPAHTPYPLLSVWHQLDIALRNYPKVNWFHLAHLCPRLLSFCHWKIHRLKIGSSEHWP